MQRAVRAPASILFNAGAKFVSSLSADATLRRPLQHAHEHAISQDEAEAMVATFDLERVGFLLVHWTNSPRGLQALIQPVPLDPYDWEH